MRQKLDITDAELATKIRAKYLRALENEEFDLLHGSTFVRSFLRTYAQYLGLDPQRLVDEYRARYEPREEAEYHPLVTRPPHGRERRQRQPSRGPVVAGLAVALLGFLLILGLTGDDEEEGEGGGTTAARTETQPREGGRPRGRRQRRRSAPASRVSVRVSPQETTYVCVDRGPGTEVVFEGALDAARTFRGRRVRINVGKTSASVRVNGRRLDVGSGPDPVGFDVTPRGARPIPEERRPCV